MYGYKSCPEGQIFNRLQQQIPCSANLRGQRGCVKHFAEPSNVSSSNLANEINRQKVRQHRRNPRIQDGQWGKVDVQEVTSALLDAKQAVSKDYINKKGIVLLGMTLEECEKLAEKLGQPAYRGRQIHSQLPKQDIRSLDDFFSLPKVFIQAMKDAGVKVGRSVLHDVVVSRDGTQKALLQLHDGRVVETVGIPVDEARKTRLTACISTQVGCPMRCTFCATGKGGFARNLMPHEIIDQVLTLQSLFQRRVSNIVYMGMGEPLLNIPALLTSYHYLNKTLGVGARKITISTVGVKNALPVLAAHKLQATLAVSLHAPTQELREALVPSARNYNIDALMRDCVMYKNETGRRVTFEYVLLSGVNDQLMHAQRLVALLKQYKLDCQVNLIPWNPVNESDYQRPTRDVALAFEQQLAINRVKCTIRSTRGLEASAACGQLRNAHQKEPLAEVIEAE